jgi:hypothetical protein
MERPVLVEALVACDSVLHALHGPFRNFKWMCAPIEDRRHVFELLCWSGETREKLLNVQEFRCELKNIVVSSLELLSKLCEKQPFTLIKPLDKHRMESSEVLQAPQLPLRRKKAIKTD